MNSPRGAVQSHALLLSAQLFREKDKIVRLLTLDHGKIAALAPSAATSQKRFPPALLEGFVHLKAFLHLPRGGLEGREVALWTLDKAELLGAFDHFRVGYHEISVGTFPLRLVADIVPDGPADPALFKSLGRFLRDSAVLDLKTSTWWAPLAFWTWFTHFLGFGDLTEDMEKASSEQKSFWTSWHAHLARPEAEFKSLFQQMSQADLPPLRTIELVAIYERWLALSSLHWNYFEQNLSELR